jgi:hypothetical protein
MRDTEAGMLDVLLGYLFFKVGKVTLHLTEGVSQSLELISFTHTPAVLQIEIPIIKECRERLDTH